MSPLPASMLDHRLPDGPLSDGSETARSLQTPRSLRTLRASGASPEFAMSSGSNPSSTASHACSSSAGPFSDHVSWLQAFLSQPRLAYPRWYVWFLVASFLDVIFTYAILLHGGYEANPVANAVMSWGGFDAMVVFKMLIVLLMILVCQYVYEHRKALARRFMILCTCISFVPPLWASLLLWLYVL